MGITTPDDSTLWEASLSCNGDAFGELFDRHRDRVYAHACRLTDNRTDAEDVTATAFLQLWKRRDAVTLVDRSVLPWLLVTASLCASNVRRSTRRYRTFLASLPKPTDTRDTAETFIEQNLAAGLHPDFLRALRALKPVDLQLVTLVALEGFTVAAAAPLLQLSPEAAKARLHRAKIWIRSEVHVNGLDSPLQPAQETQP